MGIFAKIFEAIGGLNTISKTGNTCCIIWLYDEPKCPKSIIEK